MSTDPLAAAGRERATDEYCPECGQTLRGGQASAIRGSERAGAIRPVFLVAFGLLLCVVFGVGAWEASKPVAASPICNDTGIGRLCDAGVRDETLIIATGYVPMAAALAVTKAAQDVRRDEQLALVGLVGVALGLAGLGVRRWGQERVAAQPWLTIANVAEWVATAIYIEILVVAAVHVANGALASTPLTFEFVRGVLDEALTGLMALVQGQ